MSRPAIGGRDISFGRPLVWLLAAILVTALAYLPGLNGPFVFDDQPNLRPLLDWLQGRTGWQDALLSNRSGLLGRPLSMLTLVINAKLSGLRSFPFKVTNLTIHLACGIVLYALLRRLLPRDEQLRQHGPTIAVLLSAVWLLHPLQVSTVLYVVQRMAQLSALFTLLALLAYVHGRTALEKSRSLAGLPWLFLAMPAATVAALLSKENGALAPLLCAVLELGYFRSTAQVRRPMAVKIFFLLGLILPGVLVVWWYSLGPGQLLASYSVRTFTFGERLLSQPRALFDYMGALLLPRGPAMGVYTDDFPVSQSLTQPLTTLFAAVGLVALVATAIAARRPAPAVFTGIMFYLAAHVMESSVFALEMYFEHRNYLPSVGFFLAIAGAVAWILGKLPPARHATTRSRLLIVGALALCTLLATATAARAWVWQSWSTMVGQAVSQHPQSTRAQFDYLGLVWNQGNPEKTQQLIDQIARTGNAQSQHLAAVYSVFLACDQNKSVEPERLARTAALAGSKLQLADMQALEQLGGFIRTHDCNGLSKIQLADMLRDIANAAPQPQSNTAVWRVRLMAASLYNYAGQEEAALLQAQETWNTGAADPAAGVLLARLQIHHGDLVGARKTSTQLHARIANWDRRNLDALADIDRMLAH